MNCGYWSNGFAISQLSAFEMVIEYIWYFWYGCDYDAVEDMHSAATLDELCS